MRVSEMVESAKSQIGNLGVDDVAAVLDDPDVLVIDVREPTEVADGTIPGALPVPRGMLEFHADPTSPMHLPDFRLDRPVVLYCKSGGRSALAGATLVSMGYTDVAHLDGGITAWTAASRPTAAPAR